MVLVPLAAVIVSFSVPASITLVPSLAVMLSAPDAPNTVLSPAFNSDNVVTLASVHRVDAAGNHDGVYA